MTGKASRAEGNRAACNARMASSKVNPWTCRICAAALRPSPTMAASTIAPLMSRRRPPRAAAAAASRIRDSACDTPSPLPEPGRGKLFKYPIVSALRCWTSTRLAVNTASASGSSQSDKSTCSRETSPTPLEPAASEARANVAARFCDIGIWLNSAAARLTRTAPQSWPRAKAAAA